MDVDTPIEFQSGIEESRTSRECTAVVVTSIRETVASATPEASYNPAPRCARLPALHGWCLVNFTYRGIALRLRPSRHSMSTNSFAVTSASHDAVSELGP